MVRYIVGNILIENMTLKPNHVVENGNSSVARVLLAELVWIEQQDHNYVDILSFPGTPQSKDLEQVTNISSQLSR